MTETIIQKLDAFFKRRAPMSAYVEVLRKQPLAREFWLAEDEALKKIFDDVNDQRFNEGITQITEELYQKILRRKAVPKGEEQKYKELCLRNARRLEWDSAGIFLGLREEMANQWQIFVQESLVNMGVWEQFQKEYGPDSLKGKIISTDPVKPYF